MIVIFDLDGTLLNTIDDLGYACNYALEQTGFPTYPISDYPAKVGNGINNLIRRALPEQERTEENVMRVREYFVPYYNEHNCVYTRPYEGIPEVLAALKQRGCKLAVASNKYQAATEKIVTHYFPGIFDVILGEREGIERKPDPQIVYDILHALQPDNNHSNDNAHPTDNHPTDKHPTDKHPDNNHSTDKHPEEVLYIGDSLVDYATATNAHVPFLACSWGFVPYAQLLSANIPHIITTPMQIPGNVK